MRWVALAVVVAVAAAPQASAGTEVRSPTLRIASAETLSVVGSGFRPRSLVTLRVVGSGIDRKTTLRTGPRGGFTFRYPGLDRCEPHVVVATAGGVSVRIPTVWFTRSCIAPPPIEPGVPPDA
jgi:hypothetical protein